MRHFIHPSQLRVAAFAAVLAFAFTSLAQGVTGSALFGKITEPGGQPIPDAVVEIRNESTGATFVAVTDGSGGYMLDNVPPGGPYTVSVSATGFFGTQGKGYQLLLGNRLKLDAKLQKQEEMGEQLTVVGHELDAFSDRGRNGPSTTVTGKQMVELPLQGRNFSDLISTAPQAANGSMAGQNTKFNNIQIDGASYNDMFGLASNGTPGGQAGAKALSIEAIDSFVVQVSPFDVRYGNFAGGMVNAITKSGSNEFRGSLFGYWQNKKLAGDRDDPTFLDYNVLQYGVSLGGPIIKDKLHFFITTDLQSRKSAFGNAFQLSGDPTDDLARAGFTNAEAERFQSILTNKYGMQNPGTALGTSLHNPDHNLFAKLSTSAIPNSYAEVSYNLVTADQDNLTRSPTSPSIPGRLRDGYQLSNAGYAQSTASHVARVKLTSSWLDGKLSNEFLTGFSILRDQRDPSDNSPLILVKSGKLGTADSWLAAGAERFSQLNTLDQDIYQLQDSLTYKMGSHALTAGTSTEYLKIRNAFLQASTGVWAFNSLDDLEAGRAASFQRRFGVSDVQDPGTAAFSVFQPGFYVQDNWTPFEGLSITPGLRVDIPLLSKANANPRLVDNAALAIDTSKVPSGNPLWSPRLGFNWDVDGGNTVLRGGTGIFSGRPPYVWVSNAYGVNGLSQVELTCNRNATTGAGVPAFTTDPNAQPYDCAGGTSTPTAPTNQGEIDYFDAKTKYPQNFRVALGMDRRLPLGLVGTVDLLYTRDINGWYTTDANLVRQDDLSGEGRALYGTFGATGFSAAPKRFDPVNLRQAVKVYNKNGGYVTSATFGVRKTLADIVDARVAYTYSRSMDRISLTSSQALSNFQFSPVDGNLEDRNVRASAFDRPHRLTVTGTTSLPLGFNLGLIYIGQSGTPYTWTVNGDVNADGISGNDMVFVPKDESQITLQDPTQYAALAAFIDKHPCLADSRGGFAERGACRNPWQNQLDARLGWNSPEFIKGQHLELQADFFNLPNMLNADWGLFRQDANFETHAAQFLKAVGYDAANNRPIYTFTEPTETTTVVHSPTASRWRVQVGARYVF
ncbi:TonB-dependent receptor [Aggregicoccus sp. 17bor-14]|uniref:TonB-dependent receptor n=1 Tax=Myxococcaceae TaxID=31 RepID=UPI00129C1B0D|nr:MULTISPECIES: carboxypeptidase regulatory-like domain-containing protein [Myxococcaceae]MBF5043812.1 TonB-dependent receptor [Simulacricoccus sp. 17bor-14]MRI89565.1 TonB-dependent receptor [Aggregicoccus sp. 17bor-14]